MFTYAHRLKYRYRYEYMYAATGTGTACTGRRSDHSLSIGCQPANSDLLVGASVNMLSATKAYGVPIEAQAHVASMQAHCGPAKEACD